MKHFKTLVLLFISCLIFDDARAQTVSLTDGPLALKPGNEYTVDLKSDLKVAGIVQAQLVTADWKKVAEKWKEVEAGKQTTALKVKIPADAVKGDGYFWQILLYDSAWKKQTEAIVKEVKIGAGSAASDPK